MTSVSLDHFKMEPPVLRAMVINIFNNYYFYYNAFTVIGLEEARYELRESNTVYPIILRVLAPSGRSGILFDRPRLRLHGVPETASGNFKVSNLCYLLN